jgi:hypothetical protein
MTQELLQQAFEEVCRERDDLKAEVRRLREVVGASRTCEEMQEAMKWAGVGGIMRLRVLTRLSAAIRGKV